MKKGTALQPIISWLKMYFKQALPGLARQVALVFLAIVISTIVLLINRYEPLSVFEGLVKGSLTDFPGTLRWATPLIIAGLAAAASFRAGVWNLGIDGQLYMGAITAAVLGLSFPDLGFPWSLLLAVTGGMLAGMLWALIAGFLRAQWGTSEVVVTILQNFIAILFTDYLVLGAFHGTGGSAGTYSTNNLGQQFWMARIIRSSQVNIGLVFAILIALVLAYLLFRTTVGYEFKIVGKNPLYARYGGINVKRTILLSMAISGAIAGFVGVEEILGVHHRFPGRFSSGIGFDGVVVSLLANNHPIGILVSGLFFGALRNGAMSMERLTSVPRAMVDIIQSIIVLMVTVQFTIRHVRWGKRGQSKEPVKYQPANLNEGG